MSVILEALKKVEKDKTRKRRKKNIAEAIVQPSEGGAARSKVLLVFLIVLSAAVLLGTGAGITYFMSAKQDPAPPVAAAAKPAEAPPAPAKTAPAEAPPPPAARPSLVASPPVAASPPVLKSLPAAPTPPSRRETRRAEKSQSAPVKASAPADIPPISIGGIIWSEESGRRRALVNGSTVKEGDIVDGVRIERIDNNAVRFSRNGKAFSLSFR